MFTWSAASLLDDPPAVLLPTGAAFPPPGAADAAGAGALLEAFLSPLAVAALAHYLEAQPLRDALQLPRYAINDIPTHLESLLPASWAPPRSSLLPGRARQAPASVGWHDGKEVRCLSREGRWLAQVLVCAILRPEERGNRPLSLQRACSRRSTHIKRKMLHTRPNPPIQTPISPLKQGVPSAEWLQQLWAMMLAVPAAEPAANAADRWDALTSWPLLPTTSGVFDGTWTE